VSWILSRQQKKNKGEDKMVYFLGRDVAVAISTESTVAANDVSVASGLVISGAASGIKFAADMSTTTFAQFTAGNGLVEDLTGVDVSIGAMDEDITYLGQKGTGKVEQKKEVSVTLTHKKKNNVWDVIFNGPTQAASARGGAQINQGARWGIDMTAADTPVIGDGLSNPKDVIDSGSTNVCYGYRLHVKMLTGSTDGTTETISIPNMAITGYTVTLNADGVTEETLELSSNQTPLYSAGDNVNNTLTTQAAF